MSDSNKFLPVCGNNTAADSETNFPIYNHHHLLKMSENTGFYSNFDSVLHRRILAHLFTIGLQIFTNGYQIK